MKRLSWFRPRQSSCKPHQLVSTIGMTQGQASEEGWMNFIQPWMDNVKDTSGSYTYLCSDYALRIAAQHYEADSKTSHFAFPSDASTIMDLVLEHPVNSLAAYIIPGLYRAYKARSDASLHPDYAVLCHNMNLRLVTIYPMHGSQVTFGSFRNSNMLGPNYGAFSAGLNLSAVGGGFSVLSTTEIKVDDDKYSDPQFYIDGRPYSSSNEADIVIGCNKNLSFTYNKRKCYFNQGAPSYQGQLTRTTLNEALCLAFLGIFIPPLDTRDMSYFGDKIITFPPTRLVGVKPPSPPKPLFGLWVKWSSDGWQVGVSLNIGGYQFEFGTAEFERLLHDEDPTKDGAYTTTSGLTVKIPEFDLKGSWEQITQNEANWKVFEERLTSESFGTTQFSSMYLNSSPLLKNVTVTTLPGYTDRTGYHSGDIILTGQYLNW